MPRDDALAVPQSAEGRSLKLYELTGLYAQLNDLMQNESSDEAGGGYSQDSQTALAEALETVTKDISKKGDKVAMVIRQVEAEAEWLEHQAEQYENEAKRIRARAGVRTNNAKHVRRWLADALGQLGDATQKIAGPVLTVTLAKKSESNRVEVLDEKVIAGEFQIATLQMTLAEAHKRKLHTYVKSARADKKGLNEQFKETGILPKGTEAAEPTRNLKIY